jgi:alanyl aminopeptidase
MRYSARLGFSWPTNFFRRPRRVGAIRMRAHGPVSSLWVIASICLVFHSSPLGAAQARSAVRAHRHAAPRPAHPAALAHEIAEPRTAAADSAPPRLSHDAIPTSQAVELTLDPEKTDYHGRVTIALDVRTPTSTLRFHTRATSLGNVSLTGPNGAVTVAKIEHLVPDQARVTLAAPLAPGAYTLVVPFHKSYNTRAIALYRVVTGGRAYLFTQFEDTEAREAFPCWDEPEFKIPWSMTLTVPATDLAVSNTPIARETRDGATKRVVFARTRPLPSYLIAIAVGPFETVPITGMHMPGRVVTVRGASRMAAEAVKATPGIIRSLERYFGRPYPYEKLDLIAAPEFLFGAMENAGAVVFADRRLLIDPRSVSPEQRRSLTGDVAHELAHMWFGDLVTMKWWDDLWLNESFASWMATKVMDDVYPETRSGVTRLYSVERAFTVDSRGSTRAMRQKIAGATSLGQTANELTYSKGQAVLTMFEGWLGIPKFRAGVLDYLAEHEWGNAQGSDLWNALGKQSGENIDTAMSSFLDQPGVPLVTVEPLAGGRVRLRQRRFLISGGEAHEPDVVWHVPVILRYPGRDSVHVHRVWLTGAETTVDLGLAPAPAWIEPNANASGYYRWSIPDAMLEPIAAAARQHTLTIRERIDLVSNLTALLRAGMLHGDRYLELVAPLAADPAPEVTREVVDAFNSTRAALTTPQARTAYAAFLRGTFEPALDHFGMHPRRGEPEGVALMRPALLHLLADAADDTRVLAYAESLGSAYRRNPASVPASLVETGVLVGAERGDRAQFDDYRRRFETTTVPIERTLYLTGLGVFRDPALRAAALDYALTAPLRPQEVLMIPGAMATNSLGGEGGRGGGAQYPDEVAHWVLDHFAALTARMPPNFSARLIGLAGGCSEERLTMLRKFFDDPAHHVPGGDNSMRRLADAIEECASLHDRESGRVERWLLQRTGRP